MREDSNQHFKAVGRSTVCSQRNQHSKGSQFHTLKPTIFGHRVPCPIGVASGRAQRSEPSGSPDPTAVFAPVGLKVGKSVQPKAADVDARLAVEHQFAYDLAGGW